MIYLHILHDDLNSARVTEIYAERVERENLPGLVARQVDVDPRFIEKLLARDGSLYQVGPVQEDRSMQGMDGVEVKCWQAQVFAAETLVHVVELAETKLNAFSFTRPLAQRLFSMRNTPEARALAKALEAA